MLGALVQKADVTENAILLQARAPGETFYFLVAATPKARGVGLLAPETRQSLWGSQRVPPGSVSHRGLAKALEGAKVTAIGEFGILLSKTDSPILLFASRSAVRIEHHAHSFESEWTPTAAFGAELAKDLAEYGSDAHKKRAVTIVKRALAKLERRAEAVARDIEKMALVISLASKASWLLPEAIRTPRGATSLTVTDWTSGEPVELSLPLDPSKGAREQVEALFGKAKRSKEGLRIARERLASVGRQREQLAAIRSELEQTELAFEIDAHLAAAKRVSPKEIKLPGDTAKLSPKAEEAARSYRTFVTSRGSKILVGKGAAHNDVLTFRTARPHDLWLHAKEKKGAHVILPLKKGAQPAEPDFLDAAHLAAHFSDARAEAIVDVQYTYRKHLRKAGGEAKGLALVDREKVIALRLDPARIAALLESEET